MYPYYHEKPNNFIKLQDWFPFRSTYAYVDTEDYTADQYFARRQFPIKFMKGEYKKPGSPFVIVRVRFPSRCEPGFEEVMYELQRAILLKGHKDYKDFCNMLQNMCDEMQKEKEDKKKK